MVLGLLHRLVTSFYPEIVKIYTLKNAIEIPFLGTCRNQKSFYILGVPISRPLLLLKYIFIPLHFGTLNLLYQTSASALHRMVSKPIL